MDLLPKYLNDLKHEKKPFRCAAYKKLHQLVSSSKEEFSQESAFDVIRSCIIGFEDASERCREEAVLIIMELIGTQDHTVLDWLLPAIVTRIGLEVPAEESEEIRLLLLRLARECMTCFPHDIGPRNFIDFFQVLLINCYGDPYPDLKKEACQATIQLCSIEPKQVSAISVPLAKALKTTCLLHKHAAVRCEGVKTLAALVKHGAAEILAPGKEEQENLTTAHGLFILANDHSEAVRLSVLQVVATALLDIRDRLDYHRRYLTHLLLLTTDSFEIVRQEAMRVLSQLGKLYMLDNEDNRIDFSKRHVSIKDIEWYADDNYPDMTLSRNAGGKYPILLARPSLGSRYVVAEAARAFLPKLLDDVSALDWVIPYSNNNRKAVAIRILWVLLFHCERNSVQFAERVLGALYKALRDESQDVIDEALLCVEVLGKFLSPDEYLPFFIRRPNKNEEAEDTSGDVIVQKSKSKTVVLTSHGSQQAPTSTPTLFSTEATTVKCSIVVVLPYLILGSKHLLTAAHAGQLAEALTSPELLECDLEELLLRLLQTYNVVFKAFAEIGFIASPSKPLPADVVNDVNQRTLDSIFLYALLLVKGCPFPRVVARAQETIEVLSVTVTDSKDGVFRLHAERILYRYGSNLPVQAFSDLVLKSAGKETLSEDLKNIFIAKLSGLNYALNVTEELRYFGVLETLLWNGLYHIPTPMLDQLLRVVILPLANFNANSVACLFRKIAVNCLCAVSKSFFKEQRDEEFSKDPSLADKMTTLWCSATDSDDSETRLVCATAFPDIAIFPMSEGSANEVVQSLILRLDDSSDLIRLRIVKGLASVLSSTDMSPCLKKDLMAQMVPLTRKLLIYLDDEDESIGIREHIVACVKSLGRLSPDIVIDLTNGASTKHVDPQYCEDILASLRSK